MSTFVPTVITSKTHTIRVETDIVQVVAEISVKYKSNARADDTIHIKTQLEKADIKHDWITYIPVDYSNESWVDKLLEAGFDKTKKTLFLWQSVSLYLEADIVKETLRKIANLCVDESIIVQDFYSKAFMFGDNSKIVKRQMGMIEKMWIKNDRIYSVW